MEEFVFSTTILVYALVAAAAAAMATLPDANPVRAAGVFTAIAMGFLALMTAVEEAIMWFAVQ